MMNRVYFISCNHLKEHTTINTNVDDNILNSAIWEAQTIHIQQTIGSELYRTIAKLIETGDIHQSENQKYKMLLENYIQEPVCYWAWVEAIPYIRYKIMNKSVSGQTSDNSTPVDKSELEYLTENIRDKAQFYTQRLSDFLLEHRGEYPEYYSNRGLDDIHPSSNNYFQGVQFDGDGDVCLKTMGYNSRIVPLV